MTRIKPQQIKKRIHSNISDHNFCVERLAEQLQISTSHLRETVNDQFGMHTQKLIESIKLEKALRLLNDGHSISKIRYRTGFSNTRTLRRVFKKRLGLPPLTCQKKLSATHQPAQLLQSFIDKIWQTKNSD